MSLPAADNLLKCYSSQRFPVDQAKFSMWSAGFSLSIGAGLCAALASCVAKISYILRAMSFLLMFVFNGLMWTLFVRSLQYCQSSVQATITNSSANFFFTALLGWSLFGETLSLAWWCGASLIIIGLLLIHRGSPTVAIDTKDDEKKVR